MRNHPNVNVNKVLLYLFVLSFFSYDSILGQLNTSKKTNNFDSSLAILIMPSSNEENYKMSYEDLFSLHKNQIAMPILKKELQELGYKVLPADELINKYNFGKDESTSINDSKKNYSQTAKYLSTIGGANIRIDFEISIKGSAKR